ncbi:hypothetical protein TNCV_904431 [Trichonephila clavipes]|nr:hypothetical protein TNCV_904431 [Trichonephila clavipes]
MKGAKSLDGRKTPKSYPEGETQERQKDEARNGGSATRGVLTFARQMLNVDISRPPDGIGADELPHQHGISPGDP